MAPLPEKLRQLPKGSTNELRYFDADPAKPAGALLMSASERLNWQGGDLFPKQPMTPICLLAMAGRNRIGGLGYSLPNQLAPLFDVVTIAIYTYTYTQYPGGPELTDRTLALKLFAGKHHSKAYPTREELIDFRCCVCGVSLPARVLQAIAQAIRKTLSAAKGDQRVPAELLAKMRAFGKKGWGTARE